jgi:hypothetical protein
MIRVTRAQTWYEFPRVPVQGFFVPPACPEAICDLHQAQIGDEVAIYTEEPIPSVGLALARSCE